MADGKQIFEIESEKIVPTVAFDKVVLVGIVAAGAFIRELGIAVNIGLIVTEVAHRNDGIEKQALNARHLDITAHQKTHAPLGADDGRGQHESLLLRTAYFTVNEPACESEILVVKGVRQLEGLFRKFPIRADANALAE